MKPMDAEPPEFYAIPEGGNLKEASDRMKKILDAKYAAANLEQVVKEDNKHLNSEEQEGLLALLKKYEGPI